MFRSGLICSKCSPWNASLPASARQIGLKINWSSRCWKTHWRQQPQPGSQIADLHGNDHVEVVEIKLALDLAGTLPANRQEFLVSSFRLQFTLLVKVSQMQADVLLGGLKQLRHLVLSQPDRLVLKAH